MSAECPMEIAFVTSNAGKFEEMSRLITFATLRQVHLELPEIQGTPFEIVHEKYRYAKQHVDGPFIVEDTSLEFNALKGMPGPYIKHFLKAIGTQGLVKMLAEFENKSAIGICALAYWPGHDKYVTYVEGYVNGTIVPPRGPAKSFGWDTIFVPDADPYQRTFAQMGKDEKCSLSHRKDAANKLAKEMGRGK